MENAAETKRKAVTGVFYTEARLPFSIVQTWVGAVVRRGRGRR